MTARTRTTELTGREPRRPRRFDASDGLAALACLFAATTVALGFGMADARADAADATARADAAESAADDTDPESVATGDASVAAWSGFTVGQVIYCPIGWVASVDTTADGHQWAACM